MNDSCVSEDQFYSRYSWCLNPALSVQDLLRRFDEEIGRFQTLAGWQREESKINLYLFVCAIACTTDDYFGSRLVNVSPLYSRLPQLRPVLPPAQLLFDTIQSGLRIRDRGAWRWRQQWNACLEHVCQMLLSDSDSASAALAFGKLRSISAELLRVRLPLPLLSRRMRLPEAFRSQDMAHHDVISLIERFCAAFPPEDTPVVVVGLRTAGAYFAPLMCEYLKEKNWRHVSWFSIRPKTGTTRSEEQQLRQAVARNARVIVVDDYAASGKTIRLTLQILNHFGVQPARIAVLAPTHPAQPNWVQLAGIDKATQVFTINGPELHKTTLLTASAVEALCTEYYASQGWSSARIVKDESVEKINARLAQHSKDGHHVREKRVFKIELCGAGRTPQTKKVFFKSAGWGWLGYHAYLAGTRLKGFVPEVIGLRNGVLLTEWIDGTAVAAGVEGNSRMVPVLASYVAARSQKLTLTGDCRLERRTYRWTGADEILDILRVAYGPYVNRLKLPALRKKLYEYVTAMPTLVDGRMRPEEWIQTPEATYKTDFEQHNFGGAELDVVDPAYDLAAAMFEFRLPRESQQQLMEAYATESGDTSISERILIHKILYGTMVMKGAADNLARHKEPEVNNRRYQAGRDFLVYAMTEFCAEFIGGRKPAWSDSLFFMDLDGVFDQEILGFAHATLSGLQSLALLRSHGFSVVLNTGRGVHHVRQYCEAYGLSGGVAEFGSVFFDSVRQKEVPLIDSITAGQLARFREALSNLPGVFTDPGYEYSIRAYRYQGRLTSGLASEEVRNLLKNPEFSRLTYIARGADTYIVQKRTNKASGMKFVKRYAGCSNKPVTAIGDSEHDIGMLKAAEFAYAPANCHRLLREMGKRGECTIVNHRYQNGLLEAVQHRLRHVFAAADRKNRNLSGSFLIPDDVHGLMQTVLKAADRRMAVQFLIALSWWSL